MTEFESRNVKRKGIKTFLGRKEGCLDLECNDTESSVPVKWYSQPMSLCFLPSCCNFEDIVVKFCFYCQLPYPK